MAAMGGVVPPAGQQGQFPATPQPTVVLKQPPLKQGQQPPTQQQPAELEAEKEDKIKTKRSFMVSVSVAPEYRHKIIGRKGAVIAKLRWGGFVFSQWLKSNSVIWSGMTTE